jgi:hypothetical protein
VRGFPGEGVNASRFFFNADFSLDVAEQLSQANAVFYASKAGTRERSAGLPPWQRNGHPTVKPALTLCKWLATLLLPPAAYAPRRLLIPFAGSGSECIGAMMAGWESIVGIEQDASYVEIARQRVAYWQAQAQAPAPPKKIRVPRARAVNPVTVPKTRREQLGLFDTLIA